MQGVVIRCVVNLNVVSPSSELWLHFVFKIHFIFGGPGSITSGKKTFIRLTFSRHRISSTLLEPWDWAYGHFANWHFANWHFANWHLAKYHLANWHLANWHLANSHLANWHLANWHLVDMKFCQLAFGQLAFGQLAFCQLAFGQHEIWPTWQLVNWHLADMTFGQPHILSTSLMSSYFESILLIYGMPVYVRKMCFG